MTGPDGRQRLADAFRETYESVGLTQLELEARLQDRGIRANQSLISKWKRADRPIDLEYLPIIEEICGVPRGQILRLAGYVSDEIDVVAAIWSDTTIDDVAKGYLVQAYQFAQEVAPAPPQLEAEPSEADLAAVVPDMDDVEGEARIWGMRRLTDAQKRYEVWLLRGRRAEQARQDRAKVKRQRREAG